MRRLLLSGFSILFLFLFSCTSNNNANKISHKTNDTTYVYGNCDSVEIGCVTIELNYIKLDDNNYKMLTDSVNTDINELLFTSPFNQMKKGNFDSLKNALIEDYKSIKSDFPESGIQYSYMRKVEIETDTLGVFSIAFSGSDYFGGAHPNSFFGFMNYNKLSGKEYKLSDLLVNNYDNELDKIGEKIFRKDKGLTDNQDLEKAGYWFKDGEFVLNNNFVITKTGLKFLFNQYEIASYAQGITQIEIPYSKIKYLVKPNSVLNKFIN